MVSFLLDVSTKLYCNSWFSSVILKGFFCIQSKAYPQAWLWIVKILYLIQYYYDYQYVTRLCQRPTQCAKWSESSLVNLWNQKICTLFFCIMSHHLIFMLPTRCNSKSHDSTNVINISFLIYLRVWANVDVNAIIRSTLLYFWFQPYWIQTLAALYKCYSAIYV